METHVSMLLFGSCNFSICVSVTGQCRRRVRAVGKRDAHKQGHLQTCSVTKIVLLICRRLEWKVHGGFQLNNTLCVDDS